MEGGSGAICDKTQRRKEHREGLACLQQLVARAGHKNTAAAARTLATYAEAAAAAESTPAREVAWSMLTCSHTKIDKNEQKNTKN